MDELDVRVGAIQLLCRVTWRRVAKRLCTWLRKSFLLDKLNFFTGTQEPRCAKKKSYHITRIASMWSCCLPEDF